MAGLPPGDPQLVAMIVNHLKTQGLFDQFRRDCLADVDTKPAYLHLRQRVDNFVSNHLSNHTWSPQLNKNQLRNSIRQLVLQSGLLEQGVDRIVAQVVDPKVQHTFRPQVERVVRQFLSPGNHMDEEEPAMELDNQEAQLPSPAITSAPDFAPSQSHDPSFTKPHDGGEEDMSLGEEDEKEEERPKEEEEEEQEQEEKLGGNDKETGEESQKEMEMEVDQQTEQPERVKKEEEEDESAKEEKENEGEQEKEKKGEEGKEKKGEEGKEKKASGKHREDSSSDKLHIRQKARERLKEEYSLEDSDLEGLSDITVSSVHTSDLSSFDDESEDEEPPSDSTEEGEITSEDETVQKKLAGEESDEKKEKKPKGSRQGYVHKPFLYSRYYSDSDDEVTVEQRRRSAAKDKEERLLKRQQNRERLEEKRRQKAAQAELQEKEKQEVQRPQAKEARKERKVLEKKVALSQKRKRDSRKEDDSSTKKKSDGDPEPVKKDDAMKSRAIAQKPVKKLCEPRKTLDKNRTHSFILDLEHGTEEALRQRGGGKNERHARKEKERKENERERGASDDRARYKQKPESKKGGEVVAEEKEGIVVKGIVDDKVEKKGSKLKVDKKSSVPAREGRLSATEGSAPEDGMTKDLRKEKPSSETMKEKIKGEKSLGKTDLKQQHRLDSTGSPEERSEGEGTSDFNRKKDKQAKDVLKKSKSHPEVKSLEKVKVRQEGKEVGAGNKDKSSTSEAPKHSSDTKVKNFEAIPKVKSVSEKVRSKSRDDLKSLLVSKTDKKGQVQEAKGKLGAALSKMEFFKEKKKEGAIKEERRVSEDRVEKGKDTKGTKKTSEKKTKEPEKKGRDSDDERRISEADDLSSSSVPSAAAEVVQSGGVMASPQDSLITGLTARQVSDSLSESYPETSQVLESLTGPHVSTTQGMDSAAESDFMDPSVSESLSDLTSVSQAMDTVSDMAAVKSTDVESNFTGPGSMDTKSEPTAAQSIDAGSDLDSSQATASKSGLALPNVLDAPTESTEELQSQPTDSNPTVIPPLKSQELISPSNPLVRQSSDSPPNSDLVNPNSSEPNITFPGPSDVKLNTDPDSIRASNLMVPESSDSIPASDLTDAQPSNSEITVSQSSDMLPNPIPADTNSTSLPDDMYDALSDITPDPDDDEEAALRLAESHPPPCPIPAEADALLSLMDVCASAVAINSAEEPDRHQFESSFRDADMKMKEAALTLLSMDPYQAVSPSFITEETHVAGQPAESLVSNLVDAANAKEPSKEAANESESKSFAHDSEEGDKYNEASQDFEQKALDTAFKEEATSEINYAETQSEAKSDVCKSDISAIDEPAGESAESDASQTGTHTQSESEHTAEGTKNETGITAQETEVQEVHAQEAQMKEAPVQEVSAQAAEVQEVPKVQMQEANAQEQEGEMQEANAHSQEANAHSQEANAQEQEANAQEQEANAQEQEANAQEQEANAQRKEGNPQEQEAQIQEVQTKKAEEQEARAQDLQVQETRTHHTNAQEMQESQVQDEQDAGKQVTQAQELQEVLKVQDSQTEKAEAQAAPDAQAHEAKTQEVQMQPARRGRPPKLVKQASSASKSDGQEEDKSDASEVDERLEGRVTRKGRWSNQRVATAKETASKAQTSQEARDTGANKPLQKNSEDDEIEEGKGTPKRSSKVPDAEQKEALTKPEEAEPTGEEVEQKEVRRGRLSGAQTAAVAKPALKRKRSDQAEDPDEVGNETAAEEKEEEPAKRARKDGESATEEEEEGKEEKKEEDTERERSKEKAEEEESVKKAPRRGRPSKIIPNADDSAAPEKRDWETETGEEDEEETKIRATTRSASRLEAEKNKPIKPSTRAVSKLSGKEESSPNTRSSRSQSAAAVKGRKGDSSSPTPRTRAGQKPEEPPSKRTKR